VNRYRSNLDVEDWENTFDITVAYDWTFDISETNEVNGSFGFRLPFINPAGTLDVNANGKVNTLRRGTRTFKNQDTFRNLLTKKRFDLCTDPQSLSWDELPLEPVPQPKRILYPITGTIGLEKVARTFLSIASWNDGIETFVDEVAFTTTLNAGAGSTITLAPVPQQFRLVNAAANIAGQRVDLHKVKVSLAFPRARPAQKKTVKQRGQELEQQLEKEEVIGGYRLNANWRAAYALCVADARSREEDFKALRLDPPEVTCIESNDAFFPRGNGVTNSLRTGRQADLAQEKSFTLQRKLDDQRRKQQLDEQRKSGNTQ